MREEIIKMARASGFSVSESFYTLVGSVEDLESFFRMAQAAEREACAKLCGELHLSGDDDCGKAADAIRARRQA